MLFIHKGKEGGSQLVTWQCNCITLCVHLSVCLVVPTHVGRHTGKGIEDILSTRKYTVSITCQADTH